MAKKKEKEQNNLWIIALVAIVAIFAIVYMISSSLV